MARVKYACDLDKSVLVNNFEKRGWVSVLPDEEWNFYWCEIRYRTGATFSKLLRKILVKDSYLIDDLGKTAILKTS